MTTKLEDANFGNSSSSHSIASYRKFMKLRLRHLSFKKATRVALMELHMDYPTLIAYGEISLLLRERGILPIGHKAILEFKFFSKFMYRFHKLISVDKGLKYPFYIFKSFGIKKFINPTLTLKYHFKVKKLTQEMSQISHKDSLLKLQAFGITFGDLFYDWHMNQRKLGTIEINSPELRRDLSRFLRAVAYWDSYFEKKNIYGVFVSHTCYSQGIISRMALKYKVKSFQITADRMYQLSSKEPFADREFLEYDKNLLSQFGYQIDLNRAKERLERIRAGDKNVDAAHSLVSGYSGLETRMVLSNSNDVKCLITAHCFSDAPHAFGNQLLPDYFEWFKFILEKSRGTEYEWYVRAHPAFSKDDVRIFDQIIAEYPHVTNLNLETSVPELIRQGVNVVFTSHGTVGFEAALEGALVIGGTQNAGFRNYSFVKVPKSTNELSDMIDGLPDLLKNLRNVETEIFHYYDLHHLRSEQSWLFKELYSEFIKQVGGLRAQFTNVATFDFWLQNSSSTAQLNILKEEIGNFVDSETYFYKYISPATQSQESRN